MKPNKYYLINSSSIPVQFKEYLFTNQPNDWFVSSEGKEYHIPSEEPIEVECDLNITETYQRPSDFASK